jgi:tyrosyl-tRNA synthetase
MEGVVKINFPIEKIAAGIDMVTFLAETNIFPSKGEARKMVQGGGVSINRNKIDNIQSVIDKVFLLHYKYILIQKGKKNYFLINLV